MLKELKLDYVITSFFVSYVIVCCFDNHGRQVLKIKSYLVYIATEFFMLTAQKLVAKNPQFEISEMFDENFKNTKKIIEIVNQSIYLRGKKDTGTLREQGPKRLISSAFTFYITIFYN